MTRCQRQACCTRRWNKSFLFVASLIISTCLCYNPRLHVVKPSTTRSRHHRGLHTRMSLGEFHETERNKPLNMLNMSQTRRAINSYRKKLHNPLFVAGGRRIKQSISDSLGSSKQQEHSESSQKDDNDSAINGSTPSRKGCKPSSYLSKLDKMRGYKRDNKKKIIDAPEVERVLGMIISEDFRNDMKKRRKSYVSDWTDAFYHKRKVIPAILFLYFACLAPAVSFGTIASQITNGSIGIVEFLLSSGVSGMVYAILCGQPMSFIAPTGLTLAFISGLYRFCTLYSIPFFPVYAWVGLWTSFFFIMMGLGGASQLIRYCTRFTDEIFNALLSVNFIYESISSLQRNFQLADPMNLTMPFVSLAMALTTCWSTLQVTAFQSSKYLTQKVRNIVKDFGPVTIFVAMSYLNHLPWISKYSVPTLSVPKTFQLAQGRQFLVALNTIPVMIRLLCSLPAILLTALFFMDQNISVRVVNNPDNKLKKGSAYNLDMVALGIVTGGLSLVGLPWMCGATVQSLNHVRAMTETRYNEETEQVEIDHVTETRLAPFVVHAMIAGTIGLLPLLRYVPIPVVSGVFMFLGLKLMSGNSFLRRIRDSLVETSRLPKGHPIGVIGRVKTNIFTAVQILCLMCLWTFKQCSATAIFFPSVIGMLMAIRSFVLPKFFKKDELETLGETSPDSSPASS